MLETPDAALSETKLPISIPIAINSTAIIIDAKTVQIIFMLNCNPKNIAIINNKPVTITLQKNLFNRKGFSAKKLNYNIIYTNGVEISTRDSSYNKIIVENEDIKKIALDVKERCHSARGAFIDYFSEGNYAIIGLTLEETYGSQLGEYFYYDNTYIQSINTHGSLESINYYK